MQVITLRADAFEETVGRLAEMARSDISGRKIDAVVGVKRGGSIVCDAFCRHYPSSGYHLRTDVSLQRPSTRCRGKWTRKILKWLPLWVLNIMRIAEARLLALTKSHYAEKPIPEIWLPPELQECLNKQINPLILIIDDAIDSGDTLFAIEQNIRNLNTTAEIKTAVVTVTTDSPRINADYAIYRNGTLVRFPWSDDFR